MRLLSSVCVLPAAALTLAAALLAGCASGPVYRAAPAPGDYGYRDTQLTAQQFRVSFAGDSGVARETVENFALFRAAEVAIAHGAPRFQVTSRETAPITSHSDYGPSANVGYGWGFPYWGTGVGYSTGGASRTRYETSLLIRIGPDVPAQAADVFDAREIKANLAAMVAARQT